MLGKLVAEQGFKTSLYFVTNFCKQHQPQEQKTMAIHLEGVGGGGEDLWATTKCKQQNFLETSTS